MVLQDYKIDGEYICISKKELKRLREEYFNTMYREFNDENGEESLGEYYAGREHLCGELLAMFKED